MHRSIVSCLLVIAALMSAAPVHAGTAAFAGKVIDVADPPANLKDIGPP